LLFWSGCGDLWVDSVWDGGEEGERWEMNKDWENAGDRK